MRYGRREAWPFSPSCGVDRKVHNSYTLSSAERAYALHDGGFSCWLMRVGQLNAFPVSIEEPMRASSSHIKHTRNSGRGISWHVSFSDLHP